MSDVDVLTLEPDDARGIAAAERDGVRYRLRTGRPAVRRRGSGDRESTRRWKAAHPDRVRQQRRDSTRRKRYPDGYRVLQVVGSLHDLRCAGPGRRTGCVCDRTPGAGKILLVREVAP